MPLTGSSSASIALRSISLLLSLGALSRPLAAQDAPAPDVTPTESLEQSAPNQAVPPGRTPTVLVTALRRLREALDTPGMVSAVDAEDLRSGPDARSLPNALSRQPSTMIQKTGPGQSSPFLRGFTGFRTLLLVDGVRINNSVFREGPNQYWSTVDNFSIDTLELSLGPGSVLWGSDAIGGTVNALTGAAEAHDTWQARYFTRWASAERSLFQRVEVEGGERDSYALRLGLTHKRFGDLKAGQGSGELPGTSFDERDLDLRLDVPVEPGTDFTFVAQSVRQFDVPRTHTTVDAVPFHSSAPGTELKRDLSQGRELAYGRLAWEGEGGFYDAARFTLSWQRHQELQERLRVGAPFNPYDETGFDLHTWGAQLEFERDLASGLLTFGLEDFRDQVSSFTKSVNAAGVTSQGIQGPVADDARYELFGAYVQHEVTSGDWDTVYGLRYSNAIADADRVDNPNIPGSNPATPGNILRLEKSWNALVSSVRTTRRLDADTRIYAGLSQGFRAPNLSDLTSELTDSGIYSPTPNLEPEHYVQFELGAKAERADWKGEAALYYTRIRDMIVASPTGVFLAGVPFLTKSNVGDGTLYGVELRGERKLSPGWTAFAVASWQDGRIDQFTAGGFKVTEPSSRLMPITMVVGATYQPEGANWWVTADSYLADEADQLSLKDLTDTQRIPPGGTPGYGILGVRCGKQLTDRCTMTLGLENLFNTDYRIHGSGVNEPGRSLVLTLDVRT
ncbi:MAG: TonB-dependent receptor [Planctomycetota bacterium]